MAFSSDLKPTTQHSVGYPWFPPSLFATFSVVLLLNGAGVFFAFPCRWLFQNGDWGFALITGPLFLVSFITLISLNISDPGILHRGSLEQDPEAAYVARMHGRAFPMPWCEHCSFHRPPRTFHCPYCKICVEEFDHHCRWVNNCVGHRNIRLFLLLLASLWLYLGALLVTCIIFLVRTREMPFSLDKAMTLLVAVPATWALLPLTFGLVIQAVAVSTAGRPYETQGHFLQGNNPFDQGCARNCYITLCAPLGPKYMAEAVWLQAEEETVWKPTAGLFSLGYSPAHHQKDLPGPNYQSMDFDSVLQQEPPHHPMMPGCDLNMEACGA